MIVANFKLWFGFLLYTTQSQNTFFSNFQTRKGLPFFNVYGLEDIFYEYGVDLEIWAHEHSYERLWPIYNFKVYNGSYEEPYRNPRAPVHIITGSAVSGSNQPFYDLFAFLLCADIDCLTQQIDLSQFSQQKKNKKRKIKIRQSQTKQYPLI